MNVGRCFASALLLATVVGCSSGGPISRDLRDAATPTTFGQVKADPEGTRGTIVVWGGRIIGVANNTNGGSIYILCLPVRSNGKPVDNGPSPGRFMAVSPGFLDPELYPAGTRVTVAGPLDGIWTEPLEDIHYTYPVLEIQQVHLWPEPEPRPAPNVNVSMGPAWGPGPWGWYGYPVMYRPISPGFHGSFYAGVRVNPGRRSGGPRPPAVGPARRRR